MSYTTGVMPILYGLTNMNTNVTPINRRRDDPDYVLSETGGIYINAYSIANVALTSAHNDKCRAIAMVEDSMLYGSFRAEVIRIIEEIPDESS